MTITVPSVAELLALVEQYPVAVALLLFFAFVVTPAIWSNRPERRCAAAAVLDRLLTAATAPFTNSAIR